MPHQFLSDDWFAAAREIRAQQGDPAPAFKIKLNQVITGSPFGDDMQLHLDTSNGTYDFGKGHVESPDVTLTLDYETAKAILVDQNQQAAMQAFMAGKIRMQGDMTKLMAMQAVQPSDTEKAVAAGVKEMTA